MSDKQAVGDALMDAMVDRGFVIRELAAAAEAAVPFIACEWALSDMYAPPDPCDCAPCKAMGRLSKAAAAAREVKP